ncbi:MAG: ferritin-like domain-containing protein [Vicinamibacterales bacterium]|nr:ferritin-like domain-containing protein [Vicinamibacterales bacterium]
MTPAELAGLFQSLYRETSELLLLRQARARSITSYEANNAYQQVLGRQDVHLRWISDAITDLGGAVPEVGLDESQTSTVKGTDVKTIVQLDAKAQQAFIERWRARVETMSNARHRKMLELMLGEMAEHLRVFEQALEGRTDILGRHTEGKILRGVVLPARPRD